MEEYKPNSHKSKEKPSLQPPEHKAEPVITGPVKVRKRSGIQKFAEALFAD